ncbi:hypothetical protein SDRG_06216 [Saprolegnia diclina VS20]|uniref:AAA+ ATPase domain-containing protein n=1 Tax=Saprolegnia diclina (strain VS20) TaxID=1156394 RepID=T0QDY4_SAPDV|nr:hypothetical protein SDRG_06216 [Saprolegnia diclina VS20]EQC36099.1 hypothetical protein SDRG_06216 [Saprolegnia diclina VS20]|eukprot:XP_008610205.1 hypothetical protein SDRG_06216 [Saprolegnia diclina VS20]
MDDYGGSWEAALASRSRPPSVSMTTYVNDQILVYTARMLAATSGGRVYNSSNVHSTLVAPSPNFDLKKAASRIVHALKRHPAVVSAGTVGGHWCCKAAPKPRSSTPSTSSVASQPLSSVTSVVVQKCVAQYEEQFKPAVLDITGAGGYVTEDSIRSQVQAMAPLAPCDAVVAAIVVALGRDPRLQQQVVAGKTTIVSSPRCEEPEVPPAEAAMAAQLGALLLPQVLASVLDDKPFYVSQLRTVLSPMASGAISVDALVLAVVTVVRRDARLQYVDSLPEPFFMKPLAAIPAPRLPLASTPPRAIPESQPNTSGLTDANLATAIEAYAHAMERWLQTHDEGCGHAVVYSWKIKLPFTLPRAVVKSHILPALVQDPRFRHRPSYLANVCFGRRSASGDATVSVHNIVDQVTPYYLTAMVSTTKKGKAFTEADILGQLRVPSHVSAKAVLAGILDTLKRHPEVTSSVVGGRVSFCALREPNTPPPAPPSTTKRAPTTTKLPAITKLDPTLQPYVAAHASEYVDAILEWVASDNAFYTSYIRGQVRPTLPDDVDLDAVVAAIVQSLRRHPKLTYSDADPTRPCFVRAGGTPPALPSPKANATWKSPSSATSFRSRSSSGADSSSDESSDDDSNDAEESATPLQTLTTPDPQAPATTHFISTVHQLHDAITAHGILHNPTQARVMTLYAYGTLPHALLVLAFTGHTLVLDCAQIPATALAHALSPALQSPSVTKIVYNAHPFAALFSAVGENRLASVIDLELLLEHQTSRFSVSFAEMLSVVGLPAHPHPRYLDRPDFLNHRPLLPEATQAAAATVQLLLQASDVLAKAIFDNISPLMTASNQRIHQAIACDGQRSLCFDAQQNQRLVSTEYLQAWRPHDVVSSAPVVIHEDLDDILGLLPPDLAAPLLQPEVSAKLLDIVLDLGRRPWAWVNGARFFLDPSNHDRVVTRDDLDSIVERVGGFGSDNRAGLERQLHRISAIRNRQDRIIALTIRVGRYIEGNAGLIADLLAMEDKNILFLGEPGCGKTTIVREVSRQLATKYNVCIVDTSNEIAGDGDIPHPCVGLARRMMVPSLDDQAAVMVECVQNHTPEVMVIDEIGRPNEVEAARTCKQRGVRIVASAHGDLRKLLKNKPLRGLVGGVESVTVGDALAKEKQTKDDNGPLRKLLAQRGGEPIFEVVVELRRGQYNAWRIVTDAASAVDGILAGEVYKAQVRTRATDGLYYTEKQL